MIGELKGLLSRLEPIIGEHPAIVCIRCHKRISTGIMYVDTDAATNEIYCRNVLMRWLVSRRTALLVKRLHSPD